MLNFRKICPQEARDLREYERDNMNSEDFVLSLKEGAFDYIKVEGLKGHDFVNAFDVMRTHQRQAVFWRINHHDYLTIKADVDFYNTGYMGQMCDEILHIPVKRAYSGTPILLVKRNPVTMSYESPLDAKVTQDYESARRLTVYKA